MFRLGIAFVNLEYTDLDTETNRWDGMGGYNMCVKMYLGTSEKLIQ